MTRETSMRTLWKLHRSFYNMTAKHDKLRYAHRGSTNVPVTDGQVLLHQ
jgi:hypothetical protein